MSERTLQQRLDDIEAIVRRIDSALHIPAVEQIGEYTAATYTVVGQLPELWSTTRQRLADVESAVRAHERALRMVLIEQPAPLYERVVAAGD